MITFFKKLKRHNFVASYQDNLAFRYLRSCQKILDIGSGSGRFIKLNPQKIQGLDSSRRSVDYCRSQNLKVTFGSALKPPFKANSFDGINCAHVIEHFTPQEVYKFLKQVNLLLKPQGILVLQSPILWPHFYDNLTHVKPYPPKAITRYLVEQALDTTFPPIKNRYRQLALHWRYQPFCSLLYPLNLHRRQKNGYLLVLKKVS